MRRILATALLAVTTYHALAQQIALPPGTVEGYLRNGMHYIIKPNPIPRHTIEFRLVMRVGSLQETEEQRGGAHFLEHMSTNGMKMFPGHSMIDFFERQGMKYGRDINAFTGFDRTIYWFTVPTFDASDHTIDTTLMVVRGILSDITFDEQRTRRERGVIVEELRSYDTHDPFYDLKIGNGRYKQRMPLGNEEDILSIDRNKLIDYYQQWYTPQFATLIVVGNVDARQIEHRVHQYLSDLPRHGASHVKNYSVNYKSGIALMELSDTLNTGSRLELIIPHQTIATSTIENTIEKNRDDLFLQIVTERLSAAHVPCHVSDKWYLADQNHFVFSYNRELRDSLLSDITRTAAEIKYLAIYGPTKEELDRVKGMRSQELRCDTTLSFSSKWCDDFIDYVMAGDLMTSDPQELETIKEGISQTSQKQMKDRAKALLKAMRKHLLVAYTNHQKDSGYLSENTIKEAWKTGKASEDKPLITRQHVTPTHKYPVPDFLTASHDYDTSVIVSQKTYQDLGVHEVTLRNGVRLLFRPTLDEEKRLQLMTLGRGGSADLDDNDFYRLKDAVAYMDMGGIEGVDDNALGEIMGQQNISMNVGLENQWHQLMATSDAEDAQLLMNLVYEKMHHPRKNYHDFEESQKSEIDSWGHETLLSRLMRRDPDRMMNNCVDSIVGNVLIRRPMEKADLEAMSLDEMATYYHRLYTNPQDMTIILTGNYDFQEVERAAIGTFARMQQPDSILPISDEPIQPVRRYQRQFDNDNPSQTVFNYIFAGNYDPSLQTTLTFKLMRDLLQQRLLQVLRERENIVYSPYSDLSYHGLPQRTYYFWLTIAVKNENTARMKKALREIISDLQERLVSTDELNKMKRSFVVTKRQQLNDMAPTEWKTVMATLLKNGESLDHFDRYEEILRQITPDTIRTAFRNYIDPDNYILMYKAK
ncbi:MAG: insulinase family protein [Prevotella sp.]|nr:insulinase family protein [Prevotella sp.]